MTRLVCVNRKDVITKPLQIAQQSCFASVGCFFQTARQWCFASSTVSQTKQHNSRVSLPKVTYVVHLSLSLHLTWRNDHRAYDGNWKVVGIISDYIVNMRYSLCACTHLYLWRILLSFVPLIHAASLLWISIALLFLLDEGGAAAVMLPQSGVVSFCPN